MGNGRWPLTGRDCRRRGCSGGIVPGVRPFRWTASCCGFDQALGVLILEVDGAAVAES